MKKQNWTKRILSGALAVLMVFCISGDPLSQAAALSRIPTLLPAERIPDPPEGNLVYFGTAAATLDEGDRYYAIPVYRAGDLTAEASVDVQTLDMTAVYGKDYELYMSGVKKDASGQSLLQTYMQSSGQEQAEDKVAQQTVVPEVSDTKKGKLAQLKEDATGQPVRNTYETQSDDSHLYRRT